MDELIRRRKDGEVSEPQSLTAIVNELISSQISKRQTEDSSRDVSPFAMSLMRNYLPSQVSKAYTPQLQAGIMAAFPTILEANKAKDIPRLVHLAQAYEETFAVGWIQGQLLAVNDFAGAKAKLSDMQLNELAIQIRLEYGYLNVFEFILFCARLRSGKYEDFYGSIDPMRILKSLDSFCADRRDELAREQARIEKERRDLEWEESRRNCVSFEDWYATKSEEEKEEIRRSPAFGRFTKRWDESIKAKEAQKAKETHIEE